MNHRCQTNGDELNQLLSNDFLWPTKERCGVFILVVATNESPKRLHIETEQISEQINGVSGSIVDLQLLSK